MASFSCVAEKVEQPFSWADDVEEEVERQAEAVAQASAEAPVIQVDEAKEHGEELSPATQVDEEHDDTDYADYIEEAKVYYLDPVEMLGPAGFRLAETFYDDVIINNGHLPSPLCPSPTRSAPSRRSYLSVVQLAGDEDEDEGKDEFDRNDQATGLPSTPPPILSSPVGDKSPDEGKDEIDRNDQATDLPSTPPAIPDSPVGDESKDDGKDELDRNDQLADLEIISRVDESANSQPDIGLAPSIDACDLPPTPPAILDSPHRRPGQTPHEYFVATVSIRSRLIVQLLAQLFSRLVG